MSIPDRFPAKATTPTDLSDAIVVSFGAEWHPHLLAKDFSIVIRKRVPSDPLFKWLYFHINSPVGSICARAMIKRIFLATRKEAVSLSKSINLPPSSIASYIGNQSHIGCYELGAIQFPAAPLTRTQLMERMIYHPPQSFFIVSKNAKAAIDNMAKFTPSVNLQSRNERTK